MDRFRGQQDALGSAAAVTARVLIEAQRTYHKMDASVLERCAREAVAGLWTDPLKVKTFVPVLAMRRIREVVEAGETGSGATPEA